MRGVVELKAQLLNTVLSAVWNSSWWSDNQSGRGDAKILFSVNTHWTKFYFQFEKVHITNVGCARFWMCTFSYKFNVRCVQGLLLILATDVYGRCSPQILYINFICSRIINVNCICFYRHSTMVHVAWCQKQWVLVFMDTSAPVVLGLGVGVRVSDMVKVELSTTWG